MLPEKIVFKTRTQIGKNKTRKKSRVWNPLGLQKLWEKHQIIRILTRFVGCIAFFSCVEGFRSEWNGSIPTVFPPPSSVEDNPLTASFIIQNPSSLLSLKNVTTSCVMDNFVWDSSSDTKISGLETSHPQAGGKIPPSKSATVDCTLIYGMNNFSKLHISAKLFSMRARITVNYDTLFIPRKFESQHYCWVSSPPSGRGWALCDGLQDFTEK